MSSKTKAAKLQTGKRLQAEVQGSSTSLVPSKNVKSEMDLNGK